MNNDKDERSHLSRADSELLVVSRKDIASLLCSERDVGEPRFLSPLHQTLDVRLC